MSSASTPLSTQFHHLKLSHVAAAATDALVLSFDVPPVLAPQFVFQPGQYLTLRAQVGGQDLRRSYSICAAAGEPLRVGVRRVPGGVFSNWLHSTAQAGQGIDVMPPQGRFGLALSGAAPNRATEPPRHLLAIAGGSGITPLLSIVKTALAASPHTRCTVLYGNRLAASTLFKEELEDLKNRHLSRLVLHTVFSREQVDSPLHTGRLDAAKLATFLRLIGPVDHAFICGPHAMNDQAEAVLVASGLAPHQVHVERFGVPPNQLAALPAADSKAATGAVVQVVRDGVKRELRYGPHNQQLSILDAAAQAGFEMPYSCKSGVCATCRARVLQGQVTMDRNFALEPAELAAGYVLACQARPVTDHVVLSFDER
jgi:ring-1,2-phenylacetyl-CoA epoxidase subunit PaaE